MEDLFKRRPSTPSEIDRLLAHSDAQSLSFYADISQRMVSQLPSGRFSLLDIGPRTGSGLALLRMLHHPHSFAGLVLDPVTGVDTDPKFKEIAEASYPDITALHGDGFEIEGSWDIVMSSHTIEHVEDPEGFLRKLVSIAKKYVIVACPYEERELNKHHLNSITYKMLTKAGFWNLHTYRSNHWFNSLCVIAIKQI